MTDINECLHTVSRVLWRCVLIGALFLFIWAAFFMLAGDVMIQQCAIFGLSAHECSLVQYSGLGLCKIFILVFFFFPFIAIRLVLNKRRKP